MDMQHFTFTGNNTDAPRAAGSSVRFRSAPPLTIRGSRGNGWAPAPGGRHEREDVDLLPVPGEPLERPLQAVILAGIAGAATYPLVDYYPELPRPRANRSHLRHLLSQLSKAGVTEAGIVSTGQPSWREALAPDPEDPEDLGELQFFEDPIPRGTAGSIKGSNLVGSSDFLVISADVLLDDLDVSKLLAEHARSGAAVTVVAEPNDPEGRSLESIKFDRQKCIEGFRILHHSQDRRRRAADGQGPAAAGSDKPQGERQRSWRSSGVFVFSPSVLDHIPDFGYMDIKEQLIPALYRKGIPVYDYRTQTPLRKIEDLRDRPSERIAAQNPVVERRKTRGFKAYQLLKRLLDITVSAAGLVVSAPLGALIALAVKLDSPGPVFYWQRRCGKDGREFKIYKFRTMVENAEALHGELVEKKDVDGPVFKMKNDPRITRVGRFLRKTSLDELPQFVNTLRGDMSLVGPRPLIMEEMQCAPQWRDMRLMVTPGITGLWQVKGRDSVSFHEWIRHDLDYVRSQSMMLDLEVLLKTFRVLNGEGENGR
ncbi:MAG: hypothetical protein GY856_12355 [bacterium]|nr:hypothetical protein [bacterium]